MESYCYSNNILNDFYSYKEPQIIEGANIFSVIYKQQQLEFHFFILCVREILFFNEFFVMQISKEEERTKPSNSTIMIGKDIPVVDLSDDELVCVEYVPKFIKTNCILL